MIHVLEKHGFPVSIVETLFLAVCLEKWLSVWEMLATEGICLFFFYHLDFFQTTQKNPKQKKKTSLKLYSCISRLEIRIQLYIYTNNGDKKPS